MFPNIPMDSRNLSVINTVNQLFYIFEFLNIFADCRTGTCKNNIQYVFMDILVAIYFHKFVFLAKNKSLAK